MSKKEIDLRLLKALRLFKVIQLYELKKSFFIKWNKEKRCECCKNIKNVNKDNYLICKCASKEADKIFKKKVKSISILHDVIKPIERYYFYKHLLGAKQENGIKS